MKKYVVFLLLALLSFSASAETIALTFDVRKGGDNNWYSQEVKDAGTMLHSGDFVIVTYTKVTGEDCQYAICNNNGDKIYTNGADVVNGVTQNYYTCPVGDTDFSFTINDDLLSKIKSGGLTIQEKGLNTDGKMTIKVMRLENVNWNQYKPDNATEIMSTPQYIKDWYEEGYVLKTYTDYTNKTLRVVCLETGDDSYAFLKEKGNGDPAIMSGSDKFSIAGWKYFEVKINSTLNTLLQGNGLRIGGNNYYIAGIYVYDSGTTAPEWDDEASDVIDTYTFNQPLTGSSSTWDGGVVKGSFFENKGQEGSFTGEKIANTKNNIIRLCFKDAVGDGGAQVSAKDANPNSTSSSDDILNDSYGHYASYIRTRHNVENSDSYYYVDYADCSKGATHFDFELSDAILLFKDYNHHVVDNTDNAPGMKKGMLSTLLQNGMVLGVKNATIDKVEIRKSMASKYISGYAEYYHPLSDKDWRPIALPYNLTKAQVEEAFGSKAMVCDLGDSYVSKKKVTENNVSHFEYGISFSFKQVKTNNTNTDYLNANYPYIIMLGEDRSKFNYDESKGGYQGPYVIKDVKADVRDFQSYEFRTGNFSFGRQGTDVSEDEQFIANEPTDQTSKQHEIWEFEQQIVNEVQNAYMIFQSTAPVFDITNTREGEVEIINGVNLYTPYSWTDSHYYNYYFKNGALYPGNWFDTNYGIKSGLAYVRFPAETYRLFEGQNNQTTPSGVSLAKFSCNFPNDNTTGINEVEAQSKKQPLYGIYSLSGQLIRKGTSTDGLAKGIYIVNGKKIIVNQ